MLQSMAIAARRALLVAKTPAKNLTGARGYCLAAIDEQTGILVRLVAVCGEAMPFWRSCDVRGMDVGTHVLYVRCAWTPPAWLDRYPHKSDDVACSLVSIAEANPDRVSLFDVLTPLTQPSLCATWPAPLRLTHKAVRVDSKAASFAVVSGMLTRLSLLEHRSGHAELQLQDGSSFHGIRVMCTGQLRELISELPPSGEPLLRGIFIIGLTRANKDCPNSCGMLLVGCAKQTPNRSRESRRESKLAPRVCVETVKEEEDTCMH